MPETCEQGVRAIELASISSVSAIKIPPGQLTLCNWNLSESNVIWEGALKLVEQQPEEELNLIPVPSPPNPQNNALRMKISGPRLKIELYNRSNSGSGHIDLWAEVWYQPKTKIENRSDSEGISSEEHQEENILISPESSKYYKIIAQLPGSGFQVADGKYEKNNNENTKNVQVALGLKFKDSESAITFSETLAEFRRRFKNYEDQLEYEARLMELERSLQELSLSRQNSEMNTLKLDSGSENLADNDSDDDDFGDFVRGE